MKILVAVALLVASTSCLKGAQGYGTYSPVTTKGDKGDQGEKGETGSPAMFSGQRLKVQMFRTEDGAFFPTGAVYDSALHIPCTMRQTAAGLRCLPVAEGTAYYTNASCTKLVIGVSTPTEGLISAPDIAPTDSTAPQKYSAYQTVGTLVAPTELYQANVDRTGCFWRNTVGVKFVAPVEKSDLGMFAVGSVAPY